MAKQGRIGRFRILERIGKGSSATVYLCQSNGGEGRVAVKLFEGSRVRPEWLEEFKSRARIAAGLNDPGLVRVLGAGQHEGAAYFAMELVPAERLDERLKRSGPLPITDALVIAESLASILDAADAAGLPCFDIRSSKLALDQDGLLRAFDVGIMKPGTTGLAAPSYASPEQHAGLALDVRSQVYSLGVVLYELLDGQLPFRAPSLDELSSLHMSSTAPMLIPGAASLPPAVLRLLSSMLAKDPRERFQDFASLAAAIDRVLSAVGSEPTQFSTPIPGDITNSFLMETDDEDERSSQATRLSKHREPSSVPTTRAAVVQSVTDRLAGSSEAVVERESEEDDFPSFAGRRPTTAAMPTMNEAAGKSQVSLEMLVAGLVATAVGFIGSIAWWALEVFV